MKPVLVTKQKKQIIIEENKIATEYKNHKYEKI